MPTPEHPSHAHEAFNAAMLERIAHVIADVEQSTHAEIRVSIRDLREASEADLALHDLAKKEFTTLGMHRTDGSVGILLLVMYHERKFYVIGDEGVHSKVHPETWKDVAAVLGEHFKNADYEGGLQAALLKMEHHLKGKLPNRRVTGDATTPEVVVK
jgi:uncharacterized membrane protein